MNIPETLTPSSLLPSVGPQPDARMPAVGELWETSWDRRSLGLVLIAAVRETHVAVWPLTTESFTPSAPCFKVTSPHVDEPLVCWPEAEAGISNAALTRALGTVADDHVLLQIWRSLRDPEIAAPESIETYPSDDSDAAEEALAQVCDWIALLGDLDFPDPDELVGTLNPDFLQEHSIDARTLKNYVEGAPMVVAQTLNGQRLPSSATITQLSEHYNVDPRDVIAPITGWEVIELRSPQRKNKIVGIAHRDSTTDNEVRRKAWAQTQLAARQQAGGNAREEAAARVDHALALLEG